MIRVIVFAIAVAMLISCIGPTANASDPWDACCEVIIVGGQDPASFGQRTIIDWQRQTLFTGTGFPGESMDTVSWKRRQITTGVIQFLEGNPGGQAQDYFRSPGMACSSAKASDVTRCEINVPTRIRCAVFRVIPQGLVSVPKPLRDVFPALLRLRVETSRTPFTSSFAVPNMAFRMSVEPSTTIFISSYSQVIPAPGGRLCHR